MTDCVLYVRKDDLKYADDLKKAYKSSKFSEETHELLYGHYFDSFYDSITISCFEFFLQCLDEYAGNRESNVTYYFIQQYLDNSKILPLYYKYWKEIKRKAKEIQGLI